MPYSFLLNICYTLLFFDRRDVERCAERRRRRQRRRRRRSVSLPFLPENTFELAVLPR